MRTRRGSVAGSYRENREWLELATDFGAISAYLIDNLSYYDHIGSSPLQRNGSYAIPTVSSGPDDRKSHDFNNDYCLAVQTYTRSSGGNGNNLSLEFWFSVSSGASGALVDLGSPGFSQYMNSGTLNISGISGSGTVSISGLDGNGWHHFLRTTNGTSEQVYIDGIVASNRSISYTKSSTIAFVMGGLSSSPGPSMVLGLTSGSISSVALYNTYLNAGQARSLYRANGPMPADWTETFLSGVNLTVGTGYGQSRAIDLDSLMSGETGFDQMKGIRAVGLMIECTNIGAATYPLIDITLNIPAIDEGLTLAAPGTTVPFYEFGRDHYQIGATGSPYSGPGLQVADGSQGYITFLAGGGNDWFASGANMNVYVNASGSPMSTVVVNDIYVSWI